MTSFEFQRQRVAERLSQGVPEPASLEETIGRFNADVVAYYVQHPSSSVRGELTRGGRRAVRWARRPMFFVARRASRATRRASRRTSRRSAHGSPGRLASSDDDEPAEPPQLARFGRLRALIDAHLWTSPVWRRIAAEAEARNRAGLDK